MTMAPKKRTKPSSFRTKGRAKRQDTENDRHDDLMGSLQILKKKYPALEKTLANGHVFVPLLRGSDANSFDGLISAASGISGNYTVVSDEDGVSYFYCSNFNVLDCAFVLTLIFSKIDNRFSKTGSALSFERVSKGTAIRGSFFVYRSCDLSLLRYNSTAKRDVVQEKNLFNTHISVSRVVDIAEFREVSVMNYGFSRFLHSVVDALKSIKFRWAPVKINNIFAQNFKSYKCSSQMVLDEIPFASEGLLIDRQQILKQNLEAFEKTKSALEQFAKSVLEPDEGEENLEKEKARHFAAENSKLQPANPRQSSSRLNRGNQPFNKEPTGHTRYTGSSYLTHDEIKEYCVATIHATLEAVKRKSSYQILKTYIKCPRQYYIDIVYDNLNQLRSETNCNIVVLNLNNVHESTSWFDSLDLSKYTTVSTPHPSTVKVVSVGGIGEHNLKALQMLLDLIQNSQKS